REVVARREVEVPWLAHAAQLAEVGLAALGRVRVHEVRDREQERLERALRARELGLEARALLLQAAALRGVRLALRRRGLALPAGLVLVLAAVQLAELGLERRDAPVRGDRPLEVDRDAAPLAGLGDLVAALLERPRVEHRATRTAAACSGSAGASRRRRD